MHREHTKETHQQQRWSRHRAFWFLSHSLSLWLCHLASITQNRSIFRSLSRSPTVHLDCMHKFLVLYPLKNTPLIENGHSVPPFSKVHTARKELFTFPTTSVNEGP